MAPIFSYKPEDMAKAIEAVRNGSSNITAASKLYNVPRSTLADKIYGKVPEKRRMGPETILTKEEEAKLVDWMFRVAKCGFPVTKDQLLDSVQMLLKSSKREDKFPSGRPGRHWFEAFLRRHPEIAVRISQNLTKSRASVTEADIREWFNQVKSYLSEQNLLHILADMTRVFNCDETTFFLCLKGDHVLARRGQRSVYSIVNSDEKECLTTLITGNAFGTLAPPMIMFKYENLPKNITASIPGDWGVGKSKNGWMTGMSFYEYIVNIFHPWLLKEGMQLPVILFVDGHTSHLTMSLSEFCANNGIILISLYPNSTHILQPMDVAMFRPLKRDWKTAVRNWRMNNNGQRLTKEIFAPILKPVLDNLNSQKILTNGFRACGLCPFDPNAVDYTKLVSKNHPPSEDSDSLDRLRNILRQLEYELEEPKLNTFEQAGETWTGDIRDESLFKLWLSLKRKVHEEIVDNHGHFVVPENLQSGGNESLVDSDHGNLLGAVEDELHAVSIEVDDLELLHLIERSDVFIPVGEDTTRDRTLQNTPNTTLNQCEVSIINEEIPTMNEDENLQINKERNDPAAANERVPSPFRGIGFWPGQPNSKSKQTRKRQPREKLSAVVTSKTWQDYHIRKEKKRKAEELEREEKKKKRVQKAEEDRIASELKKSGKLKKREEKAQTLKSKKEQKLKKREEKKKELQMKRQIKKLKLEKTN